MSASRCVTVTIVAAGVLAATRTAAAQQAQSRDSARALRAPDSAFAALQRRGQLAMGVDQYTSVHRFDKRADGGRVELQRARDDSAEIATIRIHLRAIQAAFERGDFSTPAFVHMRDVPGASVMAARRAWIRYEVRDLPRGAELFMTTTDSLARRAIHEFIDFQRGDHRAGGADDHRHPPQ